MKNNSFIRTFVSFVLIVIFACSITPKKTFHNWVADHKDQKSSSSAPQGSWVGVAGYHCNTDNLVTESPFTFLIQPLIFEPPALISIEKSSAAASFFSLHHFYSELRGPPVA